METVSILNVPFGLLCGGGPSRPGGGGLVSDSILNVPLGLVCAINTPPLEEAQQNTTNNKRSDRTFMITKSLPLRFLFE
jgi:hypothetical protein